MNKRMKKLSTLLIAMTMVVTSMGGCGVSREGDAASSAAPAAESAETTTDVAATETAEAPAETAEESDGLIPITFQSKWIPQDQFMGYYVALEKGFYEEEGLDVTILPGGSDINVPSVVESGSAQIGTTNLYNLLSYQEQGYPLVGVAQVMQTSPFVLVCRKSEISSVEDLKGKTIGVWTGGNDSPVRALLSKYGMDPDMDATLASQGTTIDGFLDGSFDAYSAMTYNELLLAYENGYTDEDLFQIDMSEEGCGMLADCIFCNSEWLEENREAAVKFVKASIKGWAYACENVDEATDIVYAQMDQSSADYDHQLESGKRMAELVIPEGADASIVGTIDKEEVKKTADIALEYGIITKEADIDSIYDYTVVEEALK